VILIFIYCNHTRIGVEIVKSIFKIDQGIIITSIYKDGKLHGLYQEWDANGKGEVSHEYNNGTIVCDICI
jgi:antitoxin component YwqK of YwqJK toxin-antitoxin module